MTTVKSVLCVFLSVILLLLPLSSCSKKEEEYPFDSLLPEEIPDVSIYRIVVPKDCSGVLYEKAEELAESMTERLNVRVLLAFDHEAVADEEIPEILLGYTNRPRSTQWLAHLKQNDYLCRTDETGTVVIGGKTEEATLIALERFCAEILPVATAEVLMGKDAGFLFEASYGCASVTLNGFELDMYRMVLPENADSTLRSLVERTRNRIAEKSGYLLPICFENQVREGEKIIALKQISNQEYGNLAYITPSTRGIEISSHGAFGFSVALSEWETLLFSENTDGVYHCTVESFYSIPYERDAYRVAILQEVEARPLTTPEAIADTLAPIGQYTPDGILWSPLGTSTQERLLHNLAIRDYEPIVTEEEPLLPAFCRIGGMTEISSKQTWKDGPSVALYRVGSEKYGFYLIQISGKVSVDGTVVLSEFADCFDLPVVVVLHTIQQGGTVSVDAGNLTELAAIYNESYSVRGSTHVFQCYATHQTLEVTVEHREDRVGYRQICIHRKIK